MATTFHLPDKTTLTSVDRANDSFLVYDDSATALKRTSVNYALDLTSHPVGINDTQTLTNKTVTSPTISGPTLSGTVAGTYTLGGTPTFPASVVTTTGSQTLTNKTLTSPTINTATIANPTLTTDTVSEHTAANGVTVDGLNIKDSKLNTSNSVVTANITNASVTADKLATGASAALVATSQTTTSTSFTDLSTAGPAVTLNIGANGIALVIVYAAISNSGGSDASRMGFAVSGASTVAASADYSVANVGTNAQRISATFLVTSLTAGSNTFTAKYNVSGGTGTFVDRRISVVPL